MGTRIIATPNDEIKEYLDCRYISACEAMSRIFEFSIHHRTPAVEHLSFHLEGEQTCVFREGDYIDSVLVKNTVAEKWMEINKVGDFAKTLLYIPFPEHYAWNAKDREWKKRTDKRNVIGRVFHVSPFVRNLFYFKMLTNHVKGPTCHEDFYRMDNVLKESYKEACYTMSLLDDDKEYIDGIIEASSWGTGDYLRSHFMMLLISISMSTPEEVWKKIWWLLSDDILHMKRKELK